MEGLLFLGPGSNSEGCRVLIPQALASFDKPVSEQPVRKDHLDTHSHQFLQSELMDDDLIHRLKLAWQPSEERSGRLVYRPQGYLHYGVAVSDTSMISWGPSKPGSLEDLGILTPEPLSREMVDAHHISYLSKEQIFANLVASILAFHARWRYGVQGWNCEHWARLVTTGDPISYQIAETCFGLLDVTCSLRRHRSAQDHLSHYLKEVRDLVC